MNVNDMFADILKRSEQEERKLIKKRAEADPLAHKLTRVMMDASYRYYELQPTKTRRVRYCYSVHRNVAGFFLGWREVISKGAGKRDMHVSRRVKKRVIEIAQRRHAAAKARLRKPNAVVIG